MARLRDQQAVQEKEPYGFAARSGLRLSLAEPQSAGGRAPIKRFMERRLNINTVYQGSPAGTGPPEGRAPARRVSSVTKQVRQRPMESGHDCTFLGNNCQRTNGEEA